MTESERKPWASRAHITILGFLVVTAVLVVSLGRLGDIYGRARTFNLGFAVFTFFSIMLAVTWMKGSAGAMWLIIWLQGIFLPRHGYSFADTPLWAGIYLLPLVAGMLFAGPIAGALSDRMGPRPFAVAGMLIAALSFLLMSLLPVNFSYPVFALVIILNGLGMGIFFSPNRASIMNSLPANQRGAGGGMAATFMNSAMVLSIGIFFSLMIVGLSGRPARVAVPRAHRARRSSQRGPAGRQSPAGGHPVRGVPGLQPDPDAARSPSPRRVGPPAARPARAHVLPLGDLRPVLERPDLGVHVWPGRVPHRGPGVAGDGQGAAVVGRRRVPVVTSTATTRSWSCPPGARWSTRARTWSRPRAAESCEPPQPRSV